MYCKNIYSFEMSAGLGWVATVSGSVICPELYQNCRNYYVMARSSHLLGNYHARLHHPLEVCIRKKIYSFETGAGLGWVVTASGSVICPELY
jgi:hypothetical protein